MGSCAKPNKRKIKYGKLETAFRHAGYNMTTFAKALGVNKSTVSDWCMDKYCPSEDNLIKIVDVLNKSQSEYVYDIPYFRGDFEQKNINNYEMFKELGIEDKATEGLKKLKKAIDEYANCNDPMLQSMYAIYENGFTYTDVISHIIGDVKLWESILYETERVMAWHTSENYRCRFEELLNEDSSNTKFPSQIEIKEISNMIISKAISKSFNEYVSKKLKELNVDELTASEHEMKSFQEFKKIIKNS